MANDKNLKRVAQQHSQDVANMFAMKKKKGNTSSSDSSSSTSGEFKPPSTSSVVLTSKEFMSPSACQRNQSVTVSNQAFIKNMDKMNPSRPILNSYPKRRFGQEKFERQFKAN